ncbi:MAG TPA: hypothetical protein VMW29_00775 [Candidatus Bathyarchaeia archaeon]|nr:hypothetical protein [Candidatus Bathyarchaeia archaeon]
MAKVTETPVNPIVEFGKFVATIIALQHDEERDVRAGIVREGVTVEVLADAVCRAIIAKEVGEPTVDIEQLELAQEREQVGFVL